MDLEIDNTRIFEAFDGLIYPLDIAKVSMWSKTDRYAHPPYFMFKFKGMVKEDPFYARIKDAVDRYVGNIRWTVSISKPY
jgi:hypothetical protein